MKPLKAKANNFKHEIATFISHNHKKEAKSINL